MNPRFVVSMILVTLLTAHLPSADRPIRNYTAWTDNAGNQISCHDGGLTRVGDTFHWYGTCYRGNPTRLRGQPTDISCKRRGGSCCTCSCREDSARIGGRINHAKALLLHSRYTRFLDDGYFLHGTVSHGIKHLRPDRAQE